MLIHALSILLLNASAPALATRTTHDGLIPLHDLWAQQEIKPNQAGNYHIHGYFYLSDTVDPTWADGMPTFYYKTNTALDPTQGTWIAMGTPTQLAPTS